MQERLKIAIADDEAMVCIVIQNSINFEELGFDLVGVAHDGFSLLNIISEENPDIVITDISMPGLNGLDLIKEVRQKQIECKIIIISGYSQFEYTREAIKYKVDDYLLKPINEQELNDILFKLRNTILTEKKNHNMLSEVFENHNKNKESLRKLFLSRVLSEYAIPRDLSVISDEYGISFSGNYFQGLVVKLDHLESPIDTEGGFESLQLKIVRIFTQILSQYCHEILYYMDNSILYLVVNYDSDHRRVISDSYKSFFEHAKNIVDLFVGMKISLGIGDSYPNVSDIQKSLQEGMHAMYHRTILGVDRIFLYSQLSHQVDYFSTEEKKNLFKRLEKNFESIDIEDYQKCISTIFSPVVPNPLELVEMSFEIKSLFFAVNDRLENEIANKECENIKLHQGILNSVSITQLRKHMSESISNIMIKQLDEIKKKNAKPVREAIRFIKEHYHEHLDLERVSEAILFNPVYISNIFKKETGDNFVDYVNKYRVEVAKELLRTTKDNISSIANAVGFNDAKYFSKIFRKYVGLKPSEYRNIYG